MTYEFTAYADRQLQKLPRDVQRRIIEKVRFYLATEQPLHFADSIKGAGGKVYRYRIGGYRVIFDWLGDRIRVTKVDVRPSVY